MELRQHKRYRLAAPMSFEWENKSGIMQRGKGNTRDISPAAVFVITPELLPVGTAVRLRIELPGLQPENSGPLLETRAHVIRSERTGFAAIADAGFRLQLLGNEPSRKTAKDELDSSAKQFQFQRH